MPRTTRRPLVVLAIGLLAASTVVGCGTSDSTDAFGNELGTEGGSSTTAEVAEPTEGDTGTTIVADAGGTDTGATDDGTETTAPAGPPPAPEDIPVTPADDPDCRTPEDAAAITTAPEVVIPEDLAAAPFAADDIAGCGDLVTETSKVTVNYVLKSSTTGEIADQSFGREPFEVDIATGGVISGWLYGLPGMRAGGRRTLVLPPEYAYGEQGSGGIPGGDTLVFVIDAVAVS